VLLIQVEQHDIQFLSFFGPDYFAVIQCLTNDQIPKYQSVIAGQYLTQRFDDTYHYRQKDSSSSM